MVKALGSRARFSGSISWLYLLLAVCLGRVTSSLCALIVPSHNPPRRIIMTEFVNIGKTHSRGLRYKKYSAHVGFYGFS